MGNIDSNQRLKKSQMAATAVENSGWKRHIWAPEELKKYNSSRSCRTSPVILRYLSKQSEVCSHIPRSTVFLTTGEKDGKKHDGTCY